MKDKDLAYIAGFLDGDGSVMLQLKPRKVVSYGFRVKTTVCFYQNSRCKEGLFWIKKKLGIGYFSKRKDNITELRIEGFQKVKSLLEKLFPYLILKKQQVKFILKAIEIMEKKPNPRKFLEVCRLSDEISKVNYATTKKKYNYDFVKKSFIEKGLIPP